MQFSETGRYFSENRQQWVRIIRETAARKMSWTTNLNCGICVNWAFGWNHSLKIMMTHWLYFEYKTWLSCAQTPDCVLLRLRNWANSTIIIAHLGNKLSFSSKLMGFINGLVLAWLFFFKFAFPILFSYIIIRDTKHFISSCFILISLFVYTFIVSYC